MVVNGLVTVPAELAGELRRGLRLLVGDAAGAMLQASELAGAAQREESYARPRALLMEACALLDQIGWEDPPSACALQVDLRRHHRALGAALRASLVVAEDDLAEERALAGAVPLPDQPAGGLEASAHLRALREYVAAIDELSADL